MVRVADAANRDWEDMAALEWQGKPYLLIADVGDNRATRETCHIYVVAEPMRQASGAFPPTIDIAWQFPFRYPDGPRDCESVGVDTRRQEILLITKRTSPPQLYVLPLRPSSGVVITAKRLGDIPRIPSPSPLDLIANPAFGKLSSQPTAMDIRKDGRLALVLTYKEVYLFSRSPRESWAEALARTPVNISLPHLKQQESACFSLDGLVMYVSTEQQPAPLLEVDMNFDY